MKQLVIFDSIQHIRAFLICIFFVNSFRVCGQIIDTTYTSLLINPFIKIEANEAINSMYNFEFEKSQNHFLYLKHQFPLHPLPYLLLGLNYWWRIVPNYENEEWDQNVIDYMDTTAYLAKRLREENPVEGAFFLAAANAFEGRLYSERGQYRKAALSGRKSLKYLDKCQGHEEYSPELLFGDALFNYYAEWIRDEYPLLRPLLWIFPEGDKEKGLEQLKQVARNALYSRTEAQYYLMRLLSIEENDLVGGLQVAQYLNKQYPNNSYFERFYARLLYQTGQYHEAEKVCKNIMNKIDSSMVGYEANTGRYACFFLGHINEQKKNYKQAKKYYLTGMVFSEEAKATDKGYYFYSLLHLGNIHVKEGNREVAKSYFRRLIKISKRNHGANKSARKQLKEL